MVKIEESENFHPRKKKTSSINIAAFLEKFFLPKTPNINVRKVVKISGSQLLWLKSYYNFNPAAGQKDPPSPPWIGLVQDPFNIKVMKKEIPHEWNWI